MLAATGSGLTLDQAYQAAYLWMFHAGEPPKEISERGPQAVELRSERMAAFVRVPENPINQRTVLAVLASEPPDRRRVIFSTTGFTHTAMTIAEAQGIALITLESDGAATPQNRRAAQLCPADPPPPPFPPRTSEDEAVVTASNWGTTEFSAAEWIDCPGCGVNQHVSLDACRVCGTALRPRAQESDPAGSITYRCRSCGSHDVEVIRSDEVARTQ
jgi:hypothetical protein